MALPHRSKVRAARPLPTRTRVQLRVEELESRRLLSAQPLGELVATPALSLTPLVTHPSAYGLTPAQVRHAYGFDQIAFANGRVAGDGSGMTIALVTAYDQPYIAGDLHTFSTTFGLPDAPSLVKALPEGTPGVDATWSLETSLDVEWAHAIAPRANLLLVEAASSSLGDLLGAVNYARQQTGVVAVSMSWGINEFSAETYFDQYFTTPAGHIGGSGLAGGVTFVGAAGDAGAAAGASWPSISSHVLAVGGTHLTTDAAGNYIGETGWSGSGGGLSHYEARPAYQAGVQGSTMRSNPDVGYDADPQTGFAVFDSVSYGGSNGWWQVGGTSAGAPQWAGLIAIADQGLALAGKGALDGVQAAIYQMPSTAFHDVVGGSNGYTATAGYDLVTGRGSPYANRVVNSLVYGSITAPSAPSAPTSPTPPQPTTPSNPPPRRGFARHLDEVVDSGANQGNDTAGAAGNGNEADGAAFLTTDVLSALTSQPGPSAFRADHSGLLPRDVLFSQRADGINGLDTALSADDLAGLCRGASRGTEETGSDDLTNGLECALPVAKQDASMTLTTGWSRRW